MLSSHQLELALRALLMQSGVDALLMASGGPGEEEAGQRIYPGTNNGVKDSPCVIVRIGNNPTEFPPYSGNYQHDVTIEVRQKHNETEAQPDPAATFRALCAAVDDCLDMATLPDRINTAAREAQLDPPLTLTIMGTYDLQSGATTETDDDCWVCPFTFTAYGCAADILAAEA